MYLTENQPGTAAGNRSIYRKLGAEAAKLRLTVSSFERFVTVILDTDREVAYEHIIGILNGCKEHGINDVEFAADWTFEALYR